ncbi:MAG: histidine kinase, partial [Cellulosilyticaceae bacterium]
SITQKLQDDLEKKKQELEKIKEELPQIFDYTKRLKTADQKMREQLATASSDFSLEGQAHLKIVFTKANEIHRHLLRAEESENALIRRRNTLELELKDQLATILQAESLAQQLMVSLTYLQTSLAQMSEQLISVPNPDDSLKHYLSFFTCIENEKLRIARDLHDGPAQQIVSAQMNIDLCRAVIQTDLNKGLDLLAKLKSDLSDTLTEVREILFDLNPAPLEKMNFKSALENMIFSVLDPQSIGVNFYYTIDDCNISPAFQKTIYRIIQELINNIKKHARATQVILRITSAHDFIYINLMDNGIGFCVPDDIQSFHIHKKSYGIANIATRINELDGKFNITSDTTHGTVFKIQLPILHI